MAREKKTVSAESGKTWQTIRNLWPICGWPTGQIGFPEARSVHSTATWPAAYAANPCSSA